MYTTSGSTLSQVRAKETFQRVDLRDWVEQVSP